MQDKVIIAEHTILDIDYTGTKTLDVGSRNYAFANGILKLGGKTWCIEPDEDVPESKNRDIALLRAAMVSRGNVGTGRLVKWSSGEGNHLEHIAGEKPANYIIQEVTCYSIDQINQMYDVNVWDVVKLDCEGAEYEILLDWPGAIAKQITVEFHDFTGANPGGEKTYKKIFDHLSQWYNVVQHEKTTRFTANITNYWDSLFILKG